MGELTTTNDLEIICLPNRAFSRKIPFPFYKGDFFNNIVNARPVVFCALPFFYFFCLQRPEPPADLTRNTRKLEGPESLNERKARITGKVGTAGKAGKAGKKRPQNDRCTKILTNDIPCVNTRCGWKSLSEQRTSFKICRNISYLKPLYLLTKWFELNRLLLFLYLAGTEKRLLQESCISKIKEYRYRSPRSQTAASFLIHLISRWTLPLFLFQGLNWERDQRKCLRSVKFINISVDYYSLSITYLQSIHQNKMVNLFKIKVFPNTEM